MSDKRIKTLIADTFLEVAVTPFGAYSIAF